MTKAEKQKLGLKGYHRITKEFEKFDNLIIDDLVKQLKKIGFKKKKKESV